MGVPAQVNIQEISQPDLDARLVAEGIASQLERRVMFRRAMKRAVQNSMRSGAQGIKVELSGRLGGAEIARTEWYREGRVPLHTLRADIDYASVRAETTYGTIGVKVWIFRSEVLDGMNSAYNPVVEDKTRAQNAVVVLIAATQTEVRLCYNQNVPSFAKCTKGVTQVLPSVVIQLLLVKLV